MPDRTQQDAWVARVLGVSIEAAASASALDIPTKPAAPPREPGAGPNSVKVQKLRLIWEKTRAALGTEVAALQTSILDQTRETKDYPEVQAGIVVLDEIMTQLDTRLIDKLDELYVCEDTAKRAQLAGQAKAIIIEYATFVAADPLMRAIDGNPFKPVKVAGQATAVLQSLAAELR